jgi:hypothetical protein
VIGEHGDPAPRLQDLDRHIQASLELTQLVVDLDADGLERPACRMAPGSPRRCRDGGLDDLGKL